MQNITKNHVIKTEIFDSDDTNADDIEEDIEEGNEENIDLPMADSFLYAVVIMYIY